MSEAALVEAPFTLASLPKPYDSETGKCLAAPVYGLRGQRWRKRTEIAVAVDGDGISIYNVRNPRLITSYALPPQTRSLCAPSSVYFKPAGQKAQRVTYVAIEDDSRKKVEIVSFVEDASSDPSDVNTESQTKTTFALTKKNVFAVYPLASHSDNKHLGSALDLCVIYQDGSVDAISGDLATKRWAADAAEAIALAHAASAESLGQIEYAIVTDVEKARKGFLKSREDALAVIIGSALTDDQAALNIPLLVLVTNSDSSRRIHIFALPSRSKDLVTSLHPGLRHLLTHELPKSTASAADSDKATFSLHASTGKLIQLEQGSVTTFDLSGTLPRLMSTLTARGQPYTSFVRVSPALLMASDSSVCGVYDTKYTSLQGQLPLNTEPVDSPKKRKRADADPAALDFISFFSDLGLAVAISKNTLVGLQLNTSAPAYKKSKAGTSLLINSLGKGLAKPEHAEGEAEAAFSQWTSQVDSFVDTDIDALERFLAAELENGNVAAISKKSGKPKKTLDLEKNLSIDSKNVPRIVQRTDQRKAIYLLGKMFAWTSSESQELPSLGFAFFSPSIFKWLAITGHITAAIIDRALRQADSALPEYASARVQSGDVVRALHDIDPEMYIMHEYLSWPVYIEIDEVLVALRDLIKSLDDPKPGLISKLITSGALDTTSLPEPLAISDEQGALEAAEADLEHAIAQLENGLNVRSTSLRTVFHRLHSFSPTIITTALRTHLQQVRLTFFIQLLRVELADGGWTSRYLDPIISPRVHHLEEGERPADNSLTIISNLLSCGIDAIGLTGWMVPPSREKDDTIETLRAETSAALEGAHEACEMGIYLADFELYAQQIGQQADQQEKETKKEGRLGKVDAVKRPGFEEVQEIVDPVLPMGMKVVTVEKMLQRSGGREQKKSRSLLGKERSMRVGKYSFDRIRV